MSIFDTDWEKVYEVFDGIMPQCPRISCPRACCGVNKIFLASNDERIPYNTMLVDPSELEYQSLANSSLDELGVEVIRRFLKERVQTGYSMISPVIALRRCVGDEVCKLAKDNNGRNRKPVQCSAFPFRLFDSEHPLHSVSTCPKALEIARDPEIVDKILVVRAMIGIKEYKDWLVNLRKSLGKI